MNSLKLILLTATFMLAMAFTFSCSSGDDDNNSPPSSDNSSSSGGGGEKGGNIANYRTVEIGTQMWMAENLDYAVEGSKCYNNTTANCAKYGRLYDWATAMALPASCNSNSCSGQIQTKHRGVCPSGWHIPSNAEWDALFRFADGTSGTSSPYDSPTAGRYLKATSGWNSGGNGEDTYGFAALPGGDGGSGGVFSGVGIDGFWWSASENNSYNAYRRRMYYSIESASWYDIGKDYLCSLRCVKD